MNVVAAPQISRWSIYSIGRGFKVFRTDAQVAVKLRELKINYSGLCSNLVDKLTRLPDNSFNSLMGKIEVMKATHKIAQNISLLLPKLENLLSLRFEDINDQTFYKQYYDLNTRTLDLRYLLSSQK